MKTLDRIIYSEVFAYTFGLVALVAYWVQDSVNLLIWTVFWFLIGELRRLFNPVTKSLKVTVHAKDYADFTQSLEERRNRGGIA